MIRLPQPPLSFTIHLLHCAACREQFSVSEAFVQDNYGKEKQIEQREYTISRHIAAQWENVHRNAWRESPDIVAAPILQRRWLVLDHLPDNVRNVLQLFDTVINCPRCGADNRNWLQMQTKLRRFDRVLGINAHWFPLTAVAWGIVLLIIAATFLFLLTPRYSLAQLLLLALMTGLTGHFTVQNITGSYWAQREYKFRRPYQTKANLWQQLPPTVRAGLPILPITLLVVPLAIFILLPLSFNLIGWVLGGSSPLSAGINLDRDYLRFWLLFVGGTWITLYIVALLDTNKFVQRLNNLLPPLIFTSVTRMTPVAIREAEAALKANRVIMPIIQWNNVERLPDGGIKMIGLHREETSLVGEPPETVRAQQYTIETDLWCRIVKTNLRNLNAPPAIPVRHEELNLDALVGLLPQQVY
jgi:DNA-directed RNA polymerase subunit M/transcription elongation factor TFIIS